MEDEMQDDRTTIRLTPDLKQRLKAIARRSRIDASKIVRYALEAYLVQVEKSGKVTSPEKSTDINK